MRIALIALTVCALTFLVAQAECQRVVRSGHVVQREIVVHDAPVKVIVIPSTTFQFYAAPSHPFPQAYYPGLQGYAPQPLPPLPLTPPAPALRQNGPPPVTPAAAAPATPVLSDEQLTTAAIPILRQHCASCHSYPGKDGVSLFDAQGQFAPTIERSLVWRVLETNRMPPAARSDPYKALSPQEKAAVYQWSVRGR